MRVILRETQKGMGNMGDEIVVADGYARNYLIPKKIVLAATPSNRISFQNEMKQKRRKLEELKKNIESLAKKIESVTLSFTRKAGEGDKLFGSVTSNDVEQQLKENGIEVDKRKIEIDHPLKTVGIHKVTISLHSEVKATVNLEIKREDDAENVEEDVVENVVEDVVEKVEVDEEAEAESFES